MWLLPASMRGSRMMPGIMEAVGVEAAAEAAATKQAAPSSSSDHRSLPPPAWSLLHARFPAARDNACPGAAAPAAAAPAAIAPGDAVPVAAAPEETPPQGEVAASPQGGVAASPRAVSPVAKDADPADAAALDELAAFVEKRAARASSDVADAVREQLPRALLEGAALATQVGALARSVEREGIQLTEQVHASQKALQRCLDPEALKQAGVHKAFSKAIDRELSQIRNGSFTQAAVQAAESCAFSDALADGLRATDAPAAVAMQEALRPTRPQLQEALRADFGQWCGGAAAAHARQLFQQSPSPARAAIDAAMHEIGTQGMEAVDKVLGEIRAQAAPRLSELCKAAVTAAIRKEVAQWEAAGKGRTTATGSNVAGGGATAAVAAAESSEAWARLLRQMAAPLHQQLDVAAADLEAAETSLSSARDSVAAAEAVAAASYGAAPSSEATRDFEAARGAVLQAVDAGRVAEALEKALAWDAKHQEADVSLAEVACDRSRAGQLQADEVLAQPAVASKLTGRLRFLLTFSLLQRSTLGSATVPRVEANLEWVLALINAVGDGDQAYLAGLQSGCAKMEGMLEALSRAETPPALAAGAPGQRRGVVLASRMALKGLSVLLRLRQ